MMHICFSKLNIIGSNNDLSPGRRQAIVWTSTGILLIGPLEQISKKFYLKLNRFHSRKCTWKCLQKSGHFVLASVC